VLVHHIMVSPLGFGRSYQIGYSVVLQYSYGVYDGDQSSVGLKVQILNPSSNTMCKGPTLGSASRSDFF